MTSSHFLSVLVIWNNFFGSSLISPLWLFWIFSSLSFLFSTFCVNVKVKFSLYDIEFLKFLNEAGAFLLFLLTNIDLIGFLFSLISLDSLASPLLFSKMTMFILLTSVFKLSFIKFCLFTIILFSLFSSILVLLSLSSSFSKSLIKLL